jgi:hypothetical protein
MRKILFIILILFFIIPSCFAESKILINEFLIDPQPQSMEIINTGDENIDLGGWIIDDNGGSSSIYTIPPGSIIYPNSCLVFSKDFNLNKSTSDSARLFDSGQNLMDSYPYKSSPGQGISYSRIPDKESNWSTASATLGYFNTGDLSCVVLPSLTTVPTEGPQPSITDEPTPTEIPMSYGNVYISEVMANPQTGENEWLEIYNGNDFQVNLVDWFVDDEENAGSAVRKFSLEIPAREYKGLILTSPLFNNDGDSVRLLNADKIYVDGFEYGKTVQGQTFGRVDFDLTDFCLQTESFEKSNNQCLVGLTLTPTEKPTIAEGKTLTPAMTADKKTALAKKSVDSTKTNSNLNNSKQMLRTGTYEEILGASDSRLNDYGLEIKYLTVISFSYSLLTLVSVLFKMTDIYGKGFKVLSSLVHPTRG